MEDGSLTGDLLSCIHYVYRKGGREGGKGYILKGQNFFRSAHIIQNFLTTHPLDQKKKRQPHHPVSTRKVKYRQYDEMVEILMFKIEN